MNKAQCIRITLCIGMVASSVPLANAQPEISGISFEMSAGAEHIDMPKINGFGTIIDDGPFNVLRQSDPSSDISGWGASGRGKLGIPLPPAWLLGASRLNLSLAGAAFNDHSNGVISVGAGEFLDTLPIAGTPSPGAIAGAGDTVQRAVDASYHYVIGSVTAEYPVYRGSSGQVSFEGGLAAMKSDLRWTAGHLTTGGGGFYFLDEKVESQYWGPVFGINAHTWLMPALRASFEGKYYALWYDGELKAFQQASNIAPINLGVEDDSFGSRIEARFGLEYTTAPGARIGVFTNLAWQDNIAKIVNPQIAPGLNSRVNNRPVALETDDQFTVGIEARATFSTDFLSGGR